MRLEDLFYTLSTALDPHALAREIDLDQLGGEVAPPVAPAEQKEVA